MATWLNHVENTYKSLQTVIHLLDEKHSENPQTPGPNVSLGNNLDFDDSIGLLNSGPSSHNSSSVVHELNVSLQGQVNNNSNDWFSPALDNNWNIRENNAVPDMEASSSSASPVVQEYVPIRREDPSIFHLDAFDSPPPSPGREQEDFDFHMQLDPNGAIPADYGQPEVVELSVSENVARNAQCPLELCQAFEYILKTTPENVQDKQNILKEIFQHAAILLQQAAGECPREKQEDIVDISASIELIRNSFGKTTDLSAFQAITADVKYIVNQIKTALEKFL